jgi:hypothetical protein
MFDYGNHSLTRIFLIVNRKSRELFRQSQLIYKIIYKFEIVFWNSLDFFDVEFFDAHKPNICVD